MPCLIPEILFGIGKKLIEDGDSDAVIRFALSGKQQFQAMKRVFASVTSVELYSTYYVVGWGQKCSKFEFVSNRSQLPFLLQLIGNSVTRLHVDDHFLLQWSPYIPLVEKIYARQQLVLFSAGIYCSRTFLDKFFLTFAATLKSVMIPSTSMTATFRDTLKLNSLIVLQPSAVNFASFCCKTDLLHIHTGASFMMNLQLRIPNKVEISPHLSTIKHLTFNDERLFFPRCAMDEIMLRFPSLKSIKYDVLMEFKKNDELGAKFRILNSMGYFIQTLKEVQRKLPPKITIVFKKCNKELEFPTFNECKTHFTGYYGIRSGFRCFRQKISPSAGTGRTMLEIQISQ